jgi:antitoxin ParD1/3/4
MRTGLSLIEQREAEDAAKLDNLREAARIGFTAFERGDYKAFDNAGDLARHLQDLSEEIIGKTKR